MTNTSERILFVDDDEHIIQGLKRALYKMRHHWDMSFVANGKQALRLLENQDVDVVVSDMRMPEMNGAELLNAIKSSHPGTARFILSGHADKELILQCVGATHQFLAKPCDSQTLIKAISNAIHHKKRLENDRLQELIGRITNLPSVPSVYMEISAKMERKDVDMEEIGQIVAQDPGLTAKMLQMVNSAFFGLKREISDPTEAVVYLGAETVKNLILTITTFSHFDELQSDQLSSEKTWKHSLEVAGVARELAVLEKSEKKDVENAFLAGLLHDVGKLILAGNFQEHYSQIPPASATNEYDVTPIETRLIGADHAQVGAYLFGLWGLPPAAVEAVAFHHHPLHMLEEELSPLTFLSAANAIVHRLKDGVNTFPGFGPNDGDASFLASRIRQWHAHILETN